MHGGTTVSGSAASLRSLAVSGGLLDRFANPAIGAAPAQVAGHGLIDLVVGRPGMLLEKRRRGHELPGLAEAALGNPELHPRLLQRMTAVRREALDGEHFSARSPADGRDTGPHDVAVEVHGAGTAERLPAAVLRSGEAEYVAQGPQQRHLGIDVELPVCAVDTNCDAHRPSSLGHSAPVSTHA